MQPGRLFKQLHGRYVTESSYRWRIEVYSVFDLDQVRWIQLALNGPRRHTLTIRLDPGAGQGAPPVMRALSAWLTGQPEPTHSLNVASASSVRVTPPTRPLKTVVH